MNSAGLHRGLVMALPSIANGTTLSVECKQRKVLRCGLGHPLLGEIQVYATPKRVSVPIVISRSMPWMVFSDI